MTFLTKYDAACRALAEAVTADEVMGVRIEAQALEALARVAKNLEIEIAGRKLRVRAGNSPRGDAGRRRSHGSRRLSRAAKKRFGHRTFKVGRDRRR